ncbi:hypothetical protein DAPPUDRAFT_252317 [Daphnia pulex]|uniref:Uncharacterized protein n=1 Tax=Daphnia pulex TaxID=6669 RepID=E9H2G4_DAPPU|nr:hypothetical protein DAPPUDRAFT_252317 [Daphnia pulex]|eukprot:EFX74074.1 hypothetical protein DAPPUDRAFT_252317 [Daphnia pulex]
MASSKKNFNTLQKCFNEAKILFHRMAFITEESDKECYQQIANLALLMAEGIFGVAFYLRERWNWTFNGSHDDTKSSTSRPLDEDESPDDPSPPDAAATAKGCDRCRYHSHTTEASVPATNQLGN